MKKYCENCGKETETEIIEKKETYNVYGEPIEVDARILTCASCGNELFCEELDNETLTKVYDIYRKRHNLLSPKEIKQIREQYSLSQRSFARLLNWGDKTIYRYENGSIQDSAHNSMLVFLRDPENMKTYLNENKTSLSEKERLNLLDTVEKLEQDPDYRKHHGLTSPSINIPPCEENGYKSFDYDKFCAMVLYFANRAEELLKTKLMKLLNYSDMIFFKENGISISGLRYKHLQYGPVPENFDFLLDSLEADHIIHVDITYKGEYEKHEIIPESEMPEGILSDKELEVMERVYSKFINFGSKKISDYSHREKGYESTSAGEIISYGYAKDITLF